jgi:hypothetical protein
MAKVLALPRRFKRPAPPDSTAFTPAPELEEWLRAVFIDDDGPLHNTRYEVLRDARLGCLWTAAENRKHQRTIIAQAEIMPPMAMGKWQKARAEQQIQDWFGEVPDFLLTFTTGMAEYDDATFCAVVEHELHHCGQEVDRYGAPRFQQDGSPKFGLVGHDIEEFVGVVERYGATATQLEAMRAALNRGPSVAQASIAAACGTCLVTRRHG